METSTLPITIGVIFVNTVLEIVTATIPLDTQLFSVVGSTIVNYRFFIGILLNEWKYLLLIGGVGTKLYDVLMIYRELKPAKARSCSKITSWRVVVGANRDQIGMKPRQKSQ